MQISNESFYALVIPKKLKKRRQCLRCGIEFKSAHYGNRICGGCAVKNASAPKRIEGVPGNNYIKYKNSPSADEHITY